MEQLHGERAAAQRHCPVRPVADAAVLLRRQVGQPLRAAGRRSYGSLRDLLGLDDQPLERERLGLAQLDRPVRRSAVDGSRPTAAGTRSPAPRA